MTRQGVDSYFADRMKDDKFREAILSYLELFTQDNYRNFLNDPLPDGGHYFHGVGNACKAIRNYFETVSSTQKAMDEVMAQIEEDKE